MLAETQARFRAALDAPDAAGVLPTIAGVPEPAARMEIYRRHHRESLVRHLRRRFPTVEWLLGPEPMTRLALAFIAAHPPVTPCMAEYGDHFVPFIGTTPEAARHGYLQGVAGMDWLLGEVAVAIDAPPLPITALSDHSPERLPDLRLRLQPGIRYLEDPWPVDELVRTRLGGEPPEQLVLRPARVCLEITGARGSFAVVRFDAGAFAFRQSLATGGSIGMAIDVAIAAAPAFAPGAALAELFAARLVTAISS